MRNSRIVRLEDKLQVVSEQLSKVEAQITETKVVQEVLREVIVGLRHDNKQLLDRLMAGNFTQFKQNETPEPELSTDSSKKFDLDAALESFAGEVV